MRVRAAALLAIAIAAAGCQGSSARIGHRGSLRILQRLEGDQNYFGVVLDARTGRAVAAFRTSAAIRTAVADGAGGWYVGGSFIHVNGLLRKRLVHVGPDGTIARSWRPEANGNGVSVTSLARIGSHLYVSGDFASLNGHPRLHLGAIDAVTGRLLAWRPPRKNAPNYAVLLGGPDRLYLGGYAEAPTASGLVAVRPQDGTLDPRWRGQVDTSNIEGGSVRTMVLRRHRLYFAGMFGTVDRRSVPGLAAVDHETGMLASEWRPPLRAPYCTTCTEVGALADGNGRIYAAVPSAVLALDPKTGALDRGWRARVGLTTGIYGGAGVTAMAAVGKRLYVTGSFDRIDGSTRRAFAAVDAATGRLLRSWAPVANDGSGSVLVPSGPRVLLGLQLARTVRFDVAGLEAAKQPFKKLDVLLALGGPGTVRVGLGRRCNYARWAETGRCEGRVAKWLGLVRFDSAGRKRFRRPIVGPHGRYFVRFVPTARNGEPQPPYDDAFRH
jgi:hypothetical protein